MRKSIVIIVSLLLAAISCNDRPNVIVSDNSDLEDRIEYLESRIEDLESNIYDLESKINDNEWSIQNLESRIFNLEY